MCNLEVKRKLNETPGRLRGRIAITRTRISVGHRSKTTRNGFGRVQVTMIE